MELISIVSPCYNEQDNVEQLYQRTRQTLSQFPKYCYEHIIIDNASTDNAAEILCGLAAKDENVKVIENARNFGHRRSPQHAMLCAKGDTVAMLLSDLQDPPELIGETIKEWERGTPVIVEIKNSSDEYCLMYKVRSSYYRLVARLASVSVFEHLTGFGLYGRKVIDILRTSFRDPYPYFRGMIAEIGFPHKALYYNQKKRERGIIKNNFYTIYDLAMPGIMNLSKVPLWLITLSGFIFALGSILICTGYRIAMLFFWSRFNIGLTPLVVGIFFLGSVQLIAIGVIGEYIDSIHTMVQNRPLVIEKERIHFKESLPE